MGLQPKLHAPNLLITPICSQRTILKETQEDQKWYDELRQKINGKPTPLYK